MDRQAEASRLLMGDWEQALRHQVGSEPWLLVYDFGSVLTENATYWCGLIPEEHASRVLRDPSWDVHWDEGRPSETVRGNVVEYQRIGSKRVAEPLVLARSFEGHAPNYLEILEDFRLFHNLYHDVEARTHCRFDAAGEREDVVVFEGKTVKLKLQPLQQYLAVRAMRLAVYVEFRRFSTFTPAEVGLEGYHRKIREPGLTYDLTVRAKEIGEKGYKSVSMLTGKKLLAGVAVESGVPR